MTFIFIHISFQFFFYQRSWVAYFDKVYIHNCIFISVFISDFSNVHMNSYSKKVFIYLKVDTFNVTLPFHTQFLKCLDQIFFWDKTLARRNQCPIFALIKMDNTRACQIVVTIVSYR